MIAKVISCTMMTNDVVELIISLSDAPIYHPGQWALLSFVSPEGAPIKRAYSIVHYQTLEHEIQLTFSIKILPEGKGTQIIKTLKIGDELTIDGIFGHFVLQDTQAPKVFIGTGTGIAPLISMAENTNAQKSLYFSVSYGKDLFYKDRIKSIPNLVSHIHVSREEIIDCEPGRIDLKTPAFLPDSEFYLCGNPATVTAFKAILIERGFTKIYTEMY